MNFLEIGLSVIGIMGFIFVILAVISNSNINSDIFPTQTLNGGSRIKRIGKYNNLCCLIALVIGSFTIYRLIIR